MKMVVVDQRDTQVGRFQSPQRCTFCHAHASIDNDQIVRAVNSSKFVVPEGYWEQYKMARLTFRHHIIYNSQTEVECCLMFVFTFASQRVLIDNFRVFGTVPIIDLHF